MDWVFPVKRKERCPRCKGSGYLPVEGDTGSPGITIETECKRCKGHGKIWIRNNLTIESLKELLK
tara:strand:- start:285 stop:479 length:195 start_codon:yes stop_codon:yes gene_type:complete